MMDRHQMDLGTLHSFAPGAAGGSPLSALFTTFTSTATAQSRTPMYHPSQYFSPLSPQMPSTQPTTTALAPLAAIASMPANASLQPSNIQQEIQLLCKHVRNYLAMYNTTNLNWDIIARDLNIQGYKWSPQDCQEMWKYAMMSFHAKSGVPKAFGTDVYGLAAAGTDLSTNASAAAAVVAAANKRPFGSVDTSSEATAFSFDADTGGRSAAPRQTKRRKKRSDDTGKSAAAGMSTISTPDVADFTMLTPMFESLSPVNGQPGPPAHSPKGANTGLAAEIIADLTSARGQYQQVVASLNRYYANIVGVKASNFSAFGMQAPPVGAGAYGAHAGVGAGGVIAATGGVGVDGPFGRGVGTAGRFASTDFDDFEDAQSAADEDVVEL